MTFVGFILLAAPIFFLVLLEHISRRMHDRNRFGLESDILRVGSRRVNSTCTLR